MKLRKSLSVFSLALGGVLAFWLNRPDAVLDLTPDDAVRRQQLEQELETLRPKGTYVLIDTGANRLYLMKNDQVVVDAVCSTGSGRRLKAGDRSWTFATPRGVFSIRGKAADPVWRRPDWAFLEEGKPVPEQEWERFERGVLGEYALDIGNGYFIHGTLYKRLLGQNVTHGCIRLGSDDLVRLAKTVRLGTKVYIF